LLKGAAGTRGADGAGTVGVCFNAQRNVLATTAGSSAATPLEVFTICRAPNESISKLPARVGPPKPHGARTPKHRAPGQLHSPTRRVWELGFVSNFIANSGRTDPCRATRSHLVHGDVVSCCYGALQLLRRQQLRQPAATAAEAALRWHADGSLYGEAQSPLLIDLYHKPQRALRFQGRGETQVRRALERLRRDTAGDPVAPELESLLRRAFALLVARSERPPLNAAPSTDAAGSEERCPLSPPSPWVWKTAEHETRTERMTTCRQPEQP